MMDQITPDQIRNAAAEKILAKRDQVLAEQRQLKEEMTRISTRERELDRELAECRAAAKFFDIEFGIPVADADLIELRSQAARYRAQGIVMRTRGDDREGSAFLIRAGHLDARVRELEAAKLAESTQSALPIVAPMSNKPVIAPPASQPIVAAETKAPKVRDVALDQLRDAAPMGQKAASIRRYYETTYHVDIHSKTVGMTLYRLAAENLVHRKGQVWFYGAQAGQTSTVTTENPGAETPGPVNIPSD